MWGTSSIAHRVSKVIKQRVADAQKEHDERCRVLDEEVKTAKATHAELMVGKIIGNN